MVKTITVPDMAQELGVGQRKVYAMLRDKQIPHTSTLSAAIEKFFADRGETMSPKTLDRYRELADYLSPNLKAMPISNVRAMDLHEEWRRLLASGGHDRQHGIIPTVPCPSCGAEIRQPCHDGETPLHSAHDVRRNGWLTWMAAHPETARPLSAKTVRNIASVVSSACSWAVLYGYLDEPGDGLQATQRAKAEGHGARALPGGPDGAGGAGHMAHGLSGG
jgi:hypothetical protein